MIASRFLLIFTLVLCDFLYCGKAFGAQIISGGHGPAQDLWHPRLLPPSAPSSSYVLPGESIEEAELAAEYCIHNNVDFCLPTRPGGHWLVERIESDTFSFYNWWIHEDNVFNRLPRGSLPYGADRSIPITVPGVGEIGHFTFSWRVASDPSFVTVRVDLLQNLPGRWPGFRGLNLELVTLVINWSIVFADDPQNPLQPARNTQHTARDHLLVDTRFGLWTWNMDSDRVTGATTGDVFQRSLIYPRTVMTTGRRIHGRPVRIWHRRLVFDYAVAAYEQSPVTRFGPRGNPRSGPP